MQFDVNPAALNRELAKELKERKIVSAPAWAPFVKTGPHRQQAPHDPEWWYARSASVLRAVATKGPIGSSKLSVIYGGRKNRGVAPDKFVRSGTNALRKILQQLERAGVVAQVERAGHKGRALTKKGTDLLKGAIARAKEATSA
jgi:small subunit ribosomal protein S19e